jgi:hypothetical protein
MLEHRILLVQLRTASDVQGIFDGEDGTPLGFVRWFAEGSGSWWLPFGRCLLAVHEREDEPLLFTLHRGWSLLPRREVHDADGQLVGSILGRVIHDRYSRPVAAFGEGVFRNAYQRVLGELNATAEGWRLLFSNDLAGEPFVKMLLLAATLSFAMNV